MRVALVVPAFPSASETFIVRKFLGLLAAGVDVHIVAESEDPEAWSLFPELRQRPQPRSRVQGWPRGHASKRVYAGLRWLLLASLANPIGTLRCVRSELARSFRGALGRILFAAPFLYLRPDIIHFEFGSVAAQRIDLADAVGCSVVVSFRGFDVNYHGLDCPEFYDEVWRKVHGVHFLGEELRRRAVLRGLPKEVPSTLIPPAADVGVFRARPRDDRDVGGSVRPLRLLSVGRLHWKKGYEFALEATRKLVNAGVEFEYHIVGGGPFENAVKACIKEMGLGSRVRLLGESGGEIVRREM